MEEKKSLHLLFLSPGPFALNRSDVLSVGRGGAGQSNGWHSSSNLREKK